MQELNEALLKEAREMKDKMISDAKDEAQTSGMLISKRKMLLI